MDLIYGKVVRLASIAHRFLASGHVLAISATSITAHTSGVTGSYRSSIASTEEELCAKPEIRLSPGAPRRARYLGSSAETLTALTANPIGPLFPGRMGFSGGTGRDDGQLDGVVEL